MKLYLDIDASLRFWRTVYPCDRFPAEAPRGAPVEEPAMSESDIERLRPAWLTDSFLSSGPARIDALAFGTAMRRSSARRIVRQWSGKLPEGSFFDLGQGACVASPEFLFLRMAPFLDLPELVAFGMEICGLYSLDDASSRGMRQRSMSLSSKTRLSAYLSGASNCAGAERAARALPYICERSASPMETCDELLLCLPYRLGGYGLGQPLMNSEIRLTRQAMQLAKKSVCYADLLWPDAKLILEHQGIGDHAKIERFAQDRGRIEALKAMRYTVVEVTGRQVADLAAFEQIALEIAKLTGKRVRPQGRGQTCERLELRRVLFSWNASSGYYENLRNR